MGGDIIFSYKPLMVLLTKKGISKSQFREMTGITTNSLARLGKNEYISMKVLDRICSALHCKIEDIVEHIE